jgi:hypothetical protein
MSITKYFPGCLPKKIIVQRMKTLRKMYTNYIDVPKLDSEIFSFWVRNSLLRGEILPRHKIAQYLVTQ